MLEKHVCLQDAIQTGIRIISISQPSCAKFTYFLVGFVGGSGRPDWLPTRVLMADTHSTLRRGAQTEFLQNL